jgi:hypothetical protein
MDAARVVARIEAGLVHAPKPPYFHDQVGERRFHREMEMVAHPTPGVDFPIGHRQESVDKGNPGLACRAAAVRWAIWDVTAEGSRIGLTAHKDANLSVQSHSCPVK